jgi:hypothetical protein
VALKLLLPAAMTRHLLFACALLALPAIGCVGGPPVDESAPAAITGASEPAAAARSVKSETGADHNLGVCHPKVPAARAVEPGPLDTDGVGMPPDDCGGGGDNPNGDPH